VPEGVHTRYIGPIPSMKISRSTVVCVCNGCMCVCHDRKGGGAISV
jgi:hypothetical protein